MLKDETEKQLVALTAQLEQVEVKNKHLMKKLKNNFPKPDKEKGKGKEKGKNKGKKDGDKWAWKDKPPKSNQPKKKTVDGKQYHWCRFHEKWTIHSEDECRLNTDQIKNKEKEEKEKLAALQAILHDDNNGAFADE